MSEVNEECEICADPEVTFTWKHHLFCKACKPPFAERRVEGTYVVHARVRPDGEVVNKEFTYGADKEKANRHLTLLLDQGWKADLMLRNCGGETL